MGGVYFLLATTPLPFKQARGFGFAGPQAQRPPREGRALHAVSNRGGDIWVVYNHGLRLAAPLTTLGQLNQPQGEFMRHYEIVLLIHPDQSEQVPAMLERYKSMITAGGGKVHRVEDWGRRQLVYLIQKLAKAHYLCINIEASQAVMEEIEHAFKFNDAVLRHLTVVKKKAETGPSLMMRNVEREEARKAQQQEYAAS
jgi:small subunit ribosomal protein S6